MTGYTQVELERERAARSKTKMAFGHRDDEDNQEHDNKRARLNSTDPNLQLMIETITAQARREADREREIAQQERIRADRAEKRAQQERERADREREQAESIAQQERERAEAIAQQERERADREREQADRERAKAQAIAQQARALIQQERIRANRAEALAQQERERADREREIVYKAIEMVSNLTSLTRSNIDNAHRVRSAEKKLITCVKHDEEQFSQEDRFVSVILDPSEEGDEKVARVDIIESDSFDTTEQSVADRVKRNPRIKRFATQRVNDVTETQSAIRTVGKSVLKKRKIDATIFDGDVIEWRSSSGLSFDDFVGVFTTMFGPVVIDVESVCAKMENVSITSELLLLNAMHLDTQTREILDKLSTKARIVSPMETTEARVPNAPQRAVSRPPARIMPPFPPFS